MADVNISKYTTQVVRDGSKPASPGFVVSEGQDPVNPPGTNNYVPYTGATANVDLGEYELKAGQLTLDTSPTGTAVVGTTRWNDTIGSSETTLKGGSVVLKNGVDLVARVVNKVTPNTTLTKAAYQAVRVSGAQGQRLAVAFAQANNDNNSADTIGLVTETIATNQEGFILTVGQLENINTTGSLQGETWSDGDVLYLSPTTPGAITKVKPNGSTGHIIVIGYVEYAHAIHGKIYVKIMNGWELDELHNVYINNPLNNQGLFYTSATQLWENKSIATALGYTPANAATTITINGTTQDLSTNRTYNVGTVTSVGLSSATSGVTIGSTPVTSSGTITIAIATATSTQNGLLSSTDWSTFNGKQNALTLTTTGTSGAATLVGSTLNIPIYSPDLSGYVPTSRTLTINGTTFDLSANRSWSVGTVTSVAALTLGTSGTDLSSTVANSTTTPVITLNVPTASATNRGALSAADWTTFNNKQNALTNPVTGTGTTNYLSKFTGTSTIGNSSLFDGGGFGGFNSTGINARTFVINAASGRPLALELFEFANVHSVFVRPNNSGFNLISSNYISGGVYLPLSLSGRENNADLVLQTSGNVTIGTTTDNGNKLQVNGDIQITQTISTLKTTSNNSVLVLLANNSLVDNETRIELVGRGYTSDSNSIFYRGNTQVFTGSNASLGARMTLNSSGLNIATLGTGTVYSNGGTLTNTNPSDLNLKTNVESINYGLDEILKLNPVSFHWKNDTINQGKQYGFIAQEVQKIMPDLVKQGEYLGLDKEAIFTTLVKAIQEQQVIINDLKQKIL
jgi:predicted heme/steroid binding protein/nitrogen fixation protein